MDFQVDKNRNLTLHRQLVDGLRSAAATRRPGERFPSETVLARKFGVARMTIRDALSELVGDGLLVRKRGSGTYVATPDAGVIYFLIPYAKLFIDRPTGSESTLYMYSGALEAAQRAGVKLLTLVASPTNQDTDCDLELLRKLPRGARVIVPGHWFSGCFAVLLEVAAEVVFLDVGSEDHEYFRPSTDRFHRLIIDRAAAAEALVTALAEAGCRHIALLHSMCQWLNPFWVGYRAGLQRNGLEERPELVVQGTPHDNGEHAFTLILNLRNRYPCDAVIALTPDFATGAIAAARRAGLSFPKDLQLAVLPPVATDHRRPTPFLTVELPFQTAGRVAVELLSTPHDPRIKQEQQLAWRLENRTGAAGV